ncbi:MAG TPA: tetratricopeptide repeat protein [Caulobacteraceae bacterium]|nr:tetratricopeptide repeat protein [Caulobacteraceae bacterium]
MILRSLLLVSMTAALAAAPFSATLAQDERGPEQGLRDRIDRLERQLQEVREIVLQARATGKPIEIKESGPDPMVTALSSRVDDMEQSLQGLNRQVDDVTHQLDMARKDAADQRSLVQALGDRVDKLEKAVAALQAPPPAAQPAAGETGAAPEAGPPPAADAGDPKAAYAHARQLLLNGDYPAAQAAFQAYVDQYGATRQAAEARYWLGETKYVQEDYAGAAAAYIGATKGWPQTSWAPDATVKLALALIELHRSSDACAALAEFDRHYAKGAGPAKTRADAARIRAKCGA